MACGPSWRTARHRASINARLHMRQACGYAWDGMVLSHTRKEVRRIDMWSADRSYAWLPATDLMRSVISDVMFCMGA